MTGKHLLRAALLLAAFSCVMSAATVIDLKYLPYQRVGDAWGIGTYLGNSVDHYGPTDITSPTAPSMTLIGGNINDGISGPAGNPLDISNAAWVTLLGFSPAAFDPLNLNPAPPPPVEGDNVVINGSAIAYSINAGNGDSITTWWDFVSNDDTPYDDFAFFSVYNNTLHSIEMLQVLARTDIAKSDCATITCVGLNGESGWTQLNYAFLHSDAYTVGFGSLNVTTWLNDPVLGMIPDPIGAQPGFDSALLMDAVPEPSTFLLAGSAFIAAALLRRRKTAK